MQARVPGGILKGEEESLLYSRGFEGSGMGKQSERTRKKVRWADEERLIEAAGLAVPGNRGEEDGEDTTTPLEGCDEHL